MPKEDEQEPNEVLDNNDEEVTESDEATEEVEETPDEKPLEKMISQAELDRVLQAAGASVIRGQCEMPVAVKQLTEHRQISCRGDGRLLGVRTLVNVPVLTKPVLETGIAHELPDTLRLGARQRTGLKGALD